LNGLGPSSRKVLAPECSGGGASVLLEMRGLKERGLIVGSETNTVDEATTNAASFII
jgi:hypothetical protein